MLGLADYLRTQNHQTVTAWPDGDDTADDWRLLLAAGVGKGGRPAVTTLGHAAGDLARLAGRLARFRPDVVNFHYPRGQMLYFAALRRPLGYRVVLSFHNSDLAGASDAVRARLPSWMRSAAAVTAVSDELARKMAPLAPNVPIEVIPNGVDATFWSPGECIARDPDLAIAAGRLLPLKGFDVLLEAMAACDRPGSRLILAGEGAEGPRLRQQIERLGLEGRVELAGFCERDKLRALFRQAGFFVMPSRREGMPLVLLEAMATGLPVVATSVGGVPQVMVEGVGEMVPPEDAGALASAMAKRFGQPAMQVRESASARARARRR